MRALALTLLVLASCAGGRPPRGGIEHVVLLWMRDPADDAARERLREVSEGFRAIPGVLAVETGRALPSERAIVDDSFDLGVILTFADEQGLEDYLAHPDHVAAVETVLRPLVERIVVYDVDTRR